MGSNKVEGPGWVYSQLRTIAGEIKGSSISSRKYQNLSKKLDATLEKLQDFEQKAQGVFTQSLKDTAVDLYGKLEDGLVDREVSQIQKESRSLREGRITERAIKQLESHIRTLEENHLTAFPQRQIVNEAKFALCEAKARLEGKAVSRHFDVMAKHHPQNRFVETAEVLPGEVEELFDIAKAIYNRDYRQAKGRYNGLPAALKERVEGHLQALIAVLFDDPLETMQALIAAAHDAAGTSEPYYSQEKIDAFFLGLPHVDVEESSGDKIIPLNPQV